MGIRKINESTLTAIGNAIRGKTGGSALINPEDMADEIDSISTGATITDGIVIKSVDSNHYVTEVDYYGSIMPRNMFGAGRGDSPFPWSRLQKINFMNQSVYLDFQAFVYCGLTTLSTSVIKGRNPNITWTFNSNNQQTEMFRNMKSLTVLSLPEFEGFLNPYDVYGCTALETVYLPKVTKVASYGTTNRSAFGSCTSLQTVQLGSIGYAVDNIDKNPFYLCTQSGLTVTIYTTGAYADTAVTNVRNGATNATIIVKASENTTYNGTSYSAGDTILTSEVTA